MTELPLGKTTTYPDRYAPELLFGISRNDNREMLGLGPELPFDGVDVWNAWELTWLAPNSMPRVATASILIPADSPRIVESKSLKLYLQSFRNEGIYYEAVTNRIRDDLAQAMAPEWLVVVTDWRGRGGIRSRIVATSGEVPVEWLID